MMRIAVAGAGDLAKYLVEELLETSHEVVVLSSAPKPWFDRDDISFRITDYSVSSLVTHLDDCDGVISTILDYTMKNVTTHLAILDACKQSPKCKRLIPSEFGGNTDEYPEKPVFYAANRIPIREALANQTEVMWTLFNVGWFMDYFVHKKSRYLKDIGIFGPVDLAARTIAVPGTGEDRTSFTAARDAAKAIAQLMGQDNWEPTTYVQGELSSWNEIASMLQKREIVSKITYRPVAAIKADMEQTESEEKALAAQFEDWTISGSVFLPQEKVRRQKETFFKTISFRTVEELLNEVVKHPAIIV